MRIVDLSSVVAGPYATMWLADLGAAVIKVEPPEGDTTRQAGAARSPDMGSVFLTLGRGKRSVRLDARTEAGRQAVLQLCRGADVFVHNMRPAAIERLGLGHDAVRAVQPDIIYAALAGFGPDGPYADRPAYDDVVQGLTGMATNLARVTGSPAYLPGVVADKHAGLALAAAVLAALFHRERTGQGQAVTVPLFEATAAFQLVEHLWDATFDPPLGPPGYARVLEPRRRPFPTADGFLCALPYQDKHFRALFETVDRADLAADARFGSIANRLRNVELVQSTLAELLATRPTDEWLALFERIGVPAVALQTLDELLEDPHLQAVGFFEPVEHPSEGRLRLPRSPVLLSGTPVEIDPIAPRLGEHTVEALREAGTPAALIEQVLGMAAHHDGERKDTR
ncbi:MAG: CaiB/BaiF CoA transferase family protein [Pseudonocardia sp.]